MAKQPRPTTLKGSLQGLYELARTFVFAVLLALVFRSFLIEPFHIPSGSMRTTLLEGDYIFVWKPSYGYSKYSFPLGAKIPWFSGRMMRNMPERGDVVVFRLPSNDSIDYIKRVIGLPGDRIQVVDGRLMINGETMPQDADGDSEELTDNGIIQSVPRYVETLPNGVKHTVLDESRYGEMDYTQEYQVPPRHYFMMGDNRDNSVDSRYEGQVGFVPEENLIGKAEIIVFSIDKHVKLSKPMEWYKSLRLDRFFKWII